MLSSWPHCVLHEISETYRFRRVVSSFVSSVLRMRYRRSVLGFGWSMLGPLLNHLVLGIVISHLTRFDHPRYLLYLLTGSVTFNFMSASFNQGVSSLIGGEAYIRKIYLPKLIFPLNSVLMETVNYLLGFSAVLILSPFFGGVEIGLPVLTLPLAILSFALFILGGAILLSVMGVYFRDLLHVVPILIQSLFFLTPIVYPISSLPPHLQKIIFLNPVYHYINWIRAPLIDGTLPSFGAMIGCTVFSVFLFAFSLTILKIFDNRIIFKL